MGKEQDIARLHAVEDVAMELKATTTLLLEYHNTSDYVKQDDIAAGLKRTNYEKNAISAADDRVSSRRKKRFLPINLAAIIISIVLFLVNRNIWTNSDTATLCVTWTMLLFVVGMLIELAKSPLCIIAYVVMMLPASVGAVRLGGYFLIPTALLLVSALVSAIVSNVQYSPEDKQKIEDARLADVRTELANLAHIEQVEAKFEYRSKQYPILEKKAQGLRQQITSQFPELNNMTYDLDSIQRMIFALESGRADTLEEALSHTNKIDNMQFDARMKKLDLKLNASIEKMRKQEVLASRNNDLYRAEQAATMSAEDLKNIRRKVEDARIRYGVKN